MDQVNPLVIIAVVIGGGLMLLGLIMELMGGRKQGSDPDEPIYLSAEEGGLRTQPQQRQQSSSMMPLVLIGVAVVVLIAGVAIVTNEGLDFLGDPYRDEMADICDSLDGSVEPIEMPVHGGPWQVAVIDHKGKWHSWHNSLPAERKATDVESTDVLVCVSSNRERIEEDCKYTSDGYGRTGQEVYFTIRRIVWYRDAFLVNPESHQTFRILKILGGAPPQCPAAAQKPSGINKEYGTEPQYATFYNELMRAIR